VVGDTLRSYDLFVPASYSQHGAVHAMAVVFHGLYNEDTSLERYVVPIASARGLIAVFPQGLGDSWNAGGCCGSAMETKVDDVGFVRTLVASLQARFHPRTVVAAGYSNGAMFSWYLACQPHPPVSGIVDASGTEAIDEPHCHPTVPLLVTAVHGRRDPVVPYDGGETATSEVVTAAGPFRAIPSVITEWGQDHERCRSMFTSWLPGWSTEQWTGCQTGSAVTLFTIDGMAHDVPNYPSGDPVDFGTLIVQTAARAR
jgi:polyhydroxybutyrate depolymerase